MDPHLVIRELHRVAEEVRRKYHAVDKVISSVKKSLEKLQVVYLYLKRKCDTYPYLQSQFYLVGEVELTQHFNIRRISEQDNVDIIFMLDRKYAQDFIMKPGLENNLTYIKSNFTHLTLAIEQLQRQHIHFRIQ